MMGNRTLDLRDPNDKSVIDPLGHFKLLSVMLHPTDKAARERLLSSVRADCQLPGRRTAPLTGEEAAISQKYGASRGAAAGFILGALIQIHSQGMRISLNRAIKLIQHELPVFDESNRLTWDPSLSHEHLPRHGGKLRQAYLGFGSVAHFWAALLHQQQWRKWQIEQGLDACDDIIIADVTRIPTFIATAETIWQLYSSLPIRKNRSRNRAHIPWRWIITLPNGIRGVSAVDIALPIPSDRITSFTR